MTTAVIGATGRVGREVVRGLLAEARPVRALVRDPARAHALFGEHDGLTVCDTDLADRRDLAAALAPADTVFIALASIGEPAVLARQVLTVALDAPRLRQVVRLGVLNAGPGSLGINQRAHWSIDRTAELLGLPYTTLRPVIFASMVLGAAAEVTASGTWTSAADRGAAALIDPRDVAACAVRVLSEHAHWGVHHELTGPELWTWPEIAELLTRELDRPVRLETAAVGELLARMVRAGATPGDAELLIARDLAVRAGENERITDSVRRLTGATPRPLTAFVREHRDAFA